MNGIYAFLAPVLLLLSVISFIIHFRNERKKTLIERPFYSGKSEVAEGGKISSVVQSTAEAVHQQCSHKMCRFCPLGK